MISPPTTPVTTLHGQVSCNCVGCSSGPPSCSAPVGEVLPSAAPAPALVTADNLSVPRCPDKWQTQEYYTLRYYNNVLCKIIDFQLYTCMLAELIRSASAETWFKTFSPPARCCPPQLPPSPSWASTRWTQVRVEKWRYLDITRV